MILTILLHIGGLRGAVGIALAVSLDNEVYAATEPVQTPSDAEARNFTSTLFGHVGGIAFLTLFLNGTGKYKMKSGFHSFYLEFDI